MRKLLCYLILMMLCGCDAIREKLHMMPNQDEQACLNSERLNFKDPDVLFVANLGSRGLVETPNQYWVRYKAKNSYGAYIQGNMLCTLDFSGKKWVRAQSDEFILKLNIETKLLEDAVQKMKSDPEFSKKYYENALRDPDKRIKAEEILFESPDNLNLYLPSKAKLKLENN